MKKYLLTLIMCYSGCFVYAAHYPMNLEGSYDCHGTEYDTKDSFKCQVTVKKTAQTYAIKTTCNDGTSYIGTGIYEPNKHHLSIVSINPQKTEETGIASVDIGADGALNSTWTYLNKTTLGHTNCTKRKI